MNTKKQRTLLIRLETAREMVANPGLNHTEIMRRVKERMGLGFEINSSAVRRYVPGTVREATQILSGEKGKPSPDAPKPARKPRAESRWRFNFCPNCGLPVEIAHAALQTAANLSR